MPLLLIDSSPAGGMKGEKLVPFGNDNDAHVLLFPECKPFNVEFLAACEVGIDLSNCSDMVSE